MFELHLGTSLVLLCIAVFGHINRILHFSALQSIVLISVLLIYQDALRTRRSIHGGCRS